MKRMARRQRGVAVIAVIIVYTLISAALVAMMVVFADQTKRTRGATAGTQIRQLLLAAEPLARAELQARGTGAREVPVAVPAENATLTLAISPLADGRVEVRAYAEYRDQKGVQSLVFARGAGAGAAGGQGAAPWTLSDAQLVLSP